MKRTNFLFIFLALILSGASTFSQNHTAKDSLKEKLKKDSAWLFRYRKIVPLLALDNRNTFIQRGVPVNIYGAQLGIVIHEKHSLALGGYLIRGEARRVTQKGDKNKTEKVEIDLKYLTLFYQYNFIHTRWFEIGVPLEAGLGQFTINVTDSAGNIWKGYPRTSGITPLGIGIDVTFYPLKWLGINGIAGFRKVFDSEPRMNFSGPFYAYGITIDFRYLMNLTRYGIKKSRYRKNVRHLNQKTS